MTLFKWSTTAASNDDADSTINWAEGQAPSTVNNSARAMMAAIAKWRDDMSGNLVTGGTSTAYTLTTNQSFTALTDGITVTARMNATNGATPTLNVDSLGAKSIASVYGTEVSAASLTSGSVQTFTYDSTDDKWIVHGTGGAEFPSGTDMIFYQAAAPTGWTGSDSIDDYALRVVTTSSGDGGSTEGTTAFTTAFAATTLTQANLPNVNFTITATAASDGAHQHYTFNGDTGTSAVLSSTIPTYLRNTGADNAYTIQGSATAASLGLTSSSGAHTHTVTGTAASGGSATALTLDVLVAAVIIAAKD